MNKLSLNQMALIQGGNVYRIIDGSCALVGAALVLSVAIAPQITIFCAVWGLGRWIIN